MPSAQAGGIFLHQNGMRLNAKCAFLLPEGYGYHQKCPPVNVFSEILVHFWYTELQNLPVAVTVVTHLPYVLLLYQTVCDSL